MDSLIHAVKPNNLTTSRPGRVGSVGDTVVKTRFRQSSPMMPWAYDPYWAGDRANNLGSNVQDGNTVGYDNVGGPARCRDRQWVGNRSFRHQYGWSYHDVQSPDKRTEPWLSSLGDFSWRRKLATVRIAKRTGQLFSIVPGGYQPEPNDLLRGSSQPSAQVDGVPGTNVVGTGAIPMPQPVVGKMLNGEAYGSNPTRRGISGLGIQ